MSGRRLTMVEALREALAGEMERDDRVFLLGEDIAAYGGAFGVTRGLADRFGPERVRQTPIAENSFVGMAVGAAMMGLRPVAEIMFGDFVALCADALVNHAAKIHYMYAGSLHVPLVVRAPTGRRHGYGATHSQSPEAWLLNVPGIKIVEPSTPADAKGLLLAAIRDPDPVLFLEPKLLYPVAGEVPEGDEAVPLGKARIVRPGEDLSILAFGRGIALAGEAAERLAAEGIAAEIVDLRTLAPLDLETCTASVRRTGRAVLVEEGPRTGGVTATLAAELSEQVFSQLRAPIARVTGADVPIPSGPELEDAVLPDAERVAAAARPLVRDW